jgi:hypothetical protein
VATTPEARFSKRVREGLLPLGCDIERIENRVNLGVPDMLVGIGPAFVGLELKAVTRGLKVELRPHQVAFMTRHTAKGRPCFVLVLQEGTTKRPSLIHLYGGHQAIALLEQGLRLPALASWPARGMPWDALLHWLSRPNLS